MTRRQRMIEKAREYQISTYAQKYVAPIFQRMIRAEAGARMPIYADAVINGCLGNAFRRRGQCVCITCGKVDAWSGGIGGMHTGHFLQSRRLSILFEEDNVAPQCSGCNRYHGGRPNEFEMWMQVVRGQHTIDRLKRLKNTTKTFTREQLVDMRIGFANRLKAAERRIKLDE